MKANMRIKRAADRIAGMPKAPLAQERGNGYSSNPHGPLKPGDFGVHSHPETTKLPRDPPKGELR